MMKPSIPKGMRDFSPDEMLRRNMLFSVIRSAFERHGFLPLETPSMENLSTLMGKYGEEGDKLIFKVLDSGDFLKDSDKDAFQNGDSRKFALSVAEKAMRYDLTVPFARYVVMHQHELTFPFRRYQIQPVWRADRPQKGRYREFYQCDADVIGSDSLLCELELIQLLDAVFSRLDLRVVVQINNRKILAGLAETMSAADKMIELTVAIDKLDKIGPVKVKEELAAAGFTESALNILDPLLHFKGSSHEKLSIISGLLADSEIGQRGIQEAVLLFDLIKNVSLSHLSCEFEITLARGLNYYTGAIFEVKANDPRTSFTSSICGGGRYDDLTGIFGLPGMSGVGISFGADRICDVMDEAGLFQSLQSSSTQVLAVNFGDDGLSHLIGVVDSLRKNGINAELYPDNAKLKKQFSYADARKIPFVLVYGEEERKTGAFQLKNMTNGTQLQMHLSELVVYLQNNR